MDTRKPRKPCLDLHLKTFTFDVNLKRQSDAIAIVKVLLEEKGIMTVKRHPMIYILRCITLINCLC